MSFHPGAGCEEHRDPEVISDLIATDDRIVWVDLLDPTPADFARIEAEFSLHPLALEDAQKHGQRPKLELYPDHAFVVAYSAELAEVDLFLGPTWLVSVRGRNPAGRAWSVDSVRARMEQLDASESTSGCLLYLILDELVDGYFKATGELEDRTDRFETLVFDEDPGNDRDVQAELFAIRRDLLVFRRSVAPLNEVVHDLRTGRVASIDEQTRIRLQDVHDHLLRSLDIIESEREVVSNVVDAHLAIMSFRMNQVMKRMTSYGAILLGATLVAGIYGMNFQHMPELGWSYGYPMALGIMLAITVVGYIYFSKKDWL